VLAPAFIIIASAALFSHPAHADDAVHGGTLGLFARLVVRADATGEQDWRTSFHQTSLAALRLASRREVMALSDGHGLVLDGADVGIDVEGGGVVTLCGRKKSLVYSPREL
jgi:hypothetical protein